jgi:uncharacterized membrane protein YtjA (UPF0391 family)
MRLLARILHSPFRKRRLAPFGKRHPINPSLWRTNMLTWALTFFVLALIAGVLGFGGIAGAAASIAKVLFLVFIVLLIVSAIAAALRGRPPV